ncbi:MAG TPA: SPOR domain-containing protein [Vicinamibacterales bacterium]|jgi:cell division septation protein DedD
MTDEGFHEIQLNGKQLIFLLMIATVVLVVAFLLGVMVGRGVRSEKDRLTGDVLAQTAPATTDAAAVPAPAAPPATPVVPPPAASAPPQPADEDLSYYGRLEGQTAPAESLKAPGGKAKVASGQPAKPAAPAPTGGEAVPVTAAPSWQSEPSGAGWALQIAAIRDRSEAEAVVKRLSGKGYNVYVMPPTGKGATVYRVRVGKFKTRREADTAKRRLEKEEQFKPWITR